MKLFKNRGDIYIPKSNYKSSREALILHILLIIIVLFTIAFVILLSHKYSSVAEFFGKGEVTVSENNVVEENLPKIEGKTNFLIFETDDEKTTIHYALLIQADKSSKAYKVCALSPKMKIKDKSINDIYLDGGGASLQTKLTEYFGFEIDYFADFDNSSFVDFVSKLGSFILPVEKEINFSGGKDDDKYSLHIGDGEQNVDSRALSNLLRYYTEEKKNYALVNETALYALTSLFNEENYEDSEALFRLFVKSSVTNITVRNFENNKDSLYVFCKLNNEITVYSALCEYKSNVLTQNSVKDIKGYFNK
ncbi:MAG: LCP family protein [Eubacterium sp.]|nr:LCP family protein [Eubacterium sp.]